MLVWPRMPCRSHAIAITLLSVAPVAALAVDPEGHAPDGSPLDRADLIAQDVQSSRYVGSPGSVAFAAGSSIAELPHVRIVAGGGAMKISAPLLTAGRARLDASTVLLSFPASADAALLPWVMANPQLVASTGLGPSSEVYVSAGLLHVVQSGRALNALEAQGAALAVPALVNDPAIRGQLWNSVSAGISTHLASGTTLRAELSIVMRGAAVAGSRWTTGAPVVLTLGAFMP